MDADDDNTMIGSGTKQASGIIHKRSRENDSTEKSKIFTPIIGVTCVGFG